MRGWTGGSGVGQQGLGVSLYPTSSQALGMQQEMHEKTNPPPFIPCFCSQTLKRQSTGGEHQTNGALGTCPAPAPGSHQGDWFHCGSY